jgi:DNA-binding response OmpR family regulator
MKKILVVIKEDFDLVQFLSRKLRKDSYEILHAGDAVSALSLALTENPVLIILDQNLSNGDTVIIKSRLENFRSLRRIPIVTIRNGGETNNSSLNMDDAGGIFIERPIDNLKLIRTIKTIVAA